MADDRTYIKLHDGMPDHPKVDPLTDAAFRALISGWCWCSRHLTDGRMPARTWEKRATARVRKELLASGLVEVVDDGDVQWHDYLEHQRSAEQVAAMKEQRRAAGRNGGLAKGKRGAKRVAKQTASEMLSERPSKTEAKSKHRSEGSSNKEPQTEVQPSAGSDEPPETTGQRANRLTKTYTDRVPMSAFLAVQGVVTKAIKAEKTDEQIESALQRLAESGRPVTADSLRIEIDGWQQRPRPNGPAYVERSPARADGGVPDWTPEELSR